jgi:WD40 repeat protein
MSSNVATLAPETTATATEAFDRHRGPVTCVAHIPGTNKAVTSCYDSAVALVDFDRKTMELLGYHDHLVNRVAINAAGTRAASCSSDYTVCLWDLERGKPERVLRGHLDDVEDFAFVDDHTGVSVSRDHRVIVWDLGNGAIRRILDEHQKDVLAVVCFAGRIYTSGDDMTLRQWDLETGKMLRMWGPFEQETDTCAIDPLHGRAVLGADDGCIRIFDIASGALVKEIEAHASGIKKVAVSPANGDILSAAYDQKLLVWDAGTFALKVSLHRTPNVWERSLNWSTDGRRVMAGSFDGTALLWDAADGRLLCEVGNQEKTRGNACLNDVSMNAAGDLVVVSDDGYVRRGRLTPGESRWLDTIEPVAGRMLMNGITLDDRYGLVAAGAHDHKLHIWKRAADGGLGEEIEVALGQGPINCIRIAHNPGFEGDAFVACYSSAIVRVSPRGEVRDTIQVHEGAVKALRVHPDKPIGVSCGADNLLLSWNLGGGLRKRYQGHMAIVDDVDIDPGGTKIASVSRDFTVKVYDLESAEMLHSIAIGHRSPKSVCFWDPSTVLIGDYWGALLKVDLEREKVTWHTIARNGLSSLARSGDFLAATSYDGALYLVRPSDMAVVSTLRAMRQRLVEESVV